MLLELTDITGSNQATAHVTLPPNTTLGQIFDGDERLKKVRPRIVWVSRNGGRVKDWELLQPGKNDKVVICYEPGYGLEWPVIIAIASAVISVVSFLYSLFTQPKSPKLTGATAAYNFEGLRNAMTPGNVVPVIYGEHEYAGQLLMYYVAAVDGRHDRFAALFAMCEGEIESISKVLINGISLSPTPGGSVDELPEARWDYRTGTNLQGILPGFDIVKNTFYDGRDFTSFWKKSGRASSITPVIYPTISNDVEAVEVETFWPDGVGAMRTSGDDAGSIRRIWIEYDIYFSEAGQHVWQFGGGGRVEGKSRDQIIHSTRVNFPKPGAYDLWVEQVRSSRNPRQGLDLMRVVLQNVTEIRGPAGTHSGTALLSVTGVGNKNIQGGVPTISATVRGKKVKVYSDLDNFNIEWTQNPAWAVRDYLTNSIYGNGPYTTEADLDMQSFLDFAALANSLTDACTVGTLVCSHIVHGSPFENEPVHNWWNEFSNPGSSNQEFPSPFNTETWRAISRNGGVSNFGAVMCNVCCNPGEGNPTVVGAVPPDVQCYFVEMAADYLGSSGSPVTGFCAPASASCTASNFTGYAILYNEQNHRIALHRYINQSLATTGTVIASAVRSLIPGNCLYVQIEGMNWSASINHDFIPRSGQTIGVYVSSPNFVEALTEETIFRVMDALPPTGIGHIYWRQLGAAVLPVDTGADHHSAKWGYFWNGCLWCSNAIIHDMECNAQQDLEFAQNNSPMPHDGAVFF